MARSFYGKIILFLKPAERRTPEGSFNDFALNHFAFSFGYGTSAAGQLGKWIIKESIVLLLGIASLNYLGCGTLGLRTTVNGDVSNHSGDEPAHLHDHQFFPEGALDPNDSISDEFHRTWYSKYLCVMNEPPLWDDRQKAIESYRFLWLRTFHRPICVRIEKHEEDVVLSAIELEGSGGYKAGKIVKQVEKRVELESWNHLVKLLMGVGFWNLPTRDESLGFDGAQWIIEGYRDGSYHVVDRWSPEPNGPHSGFRRICLYFLELADLLLDPEDIY
jgi:hypothetical protein